jgi:hypothetical protein
MMTDISAEFPKLGGGCPDRDVCHDSLLEMKDRSFEIAAPPARIGSN